MTQIPLWVYADLSPEQVSRLADQDNENDEYHIPVSPVDVWAEYARLRDEEGWDQQTIAKAKSVDRSFVAVRQKLHDLPDRVKRYVSQNVITEEHLRHISRVCVDTRLTPWLTTEQAWEELAYQAANTKGKKNRGEGASFSLG